MARSSLLRILRTAVPLTWRGFTILALSASLLMLGILRADMAGIFWGGSFLLACLYAVAGNHATRALISRAMKIPGAIDVHLPASALAPGEEAEAAMEVTLPRAFAPGFTVSFLLPLSWHERRIDGVRAPLSPGKNSMSVRFRAGKRGKYSAGNAILSIRDILGLGAGEFIAPVNESVRVFPLFPPGAVPWTAAEEGGQAARFASRRRRSEELLEVRKYAPGDDVRKLNWKVFAHSGELFTRIGEETPPPESRFLFILDSTSNPRVPARFAADYLDGLVEACASAMTRLLGRGTELLFLSSEASRSRSFTRESLTELTALLSEAWWTPPGRTLEFPARAGMRAIVFSTPGSPSLKRIMSAIASRGWKADLFLKDLDAGGARAPRTRRLRDFILLPPRPREPEVPSPSERDLSSFHKAMAEDMTRYRAASARISHDP
jgi:uncharacterized protein (DUF58 family)